MSDELDFKTVYDAIRKGEGSEVQLDQAVRAFGELTAGPVKWKLARLIVGLYVFVVGGIAIYLFYVGIKTDENIFGSLIDLVKIAILPIITFVLGYYYGASPK